MKSEQHPFSAALVDWYAANARSLPWRDECDPYRIWVSEVMLQQTRVTTVIPYYHRFLARFPTLEELAKAELDDVLAQWAGLGYYRRARALHAGARTLGPSYLMPDTVAGLLAVPGIGPYTAGAIASFAYGIDAPIVDGNVIRVLSRHFGLFGDPYGTKLKKTLWALAEDLIPTGGACDFNQSLMELGALVCAPRSPRCEQCPVADSCAAHADGLEEELPQKRVRGPRKELRLAVAVVRRGDDVLVRRRPQEGLFGGLWEFPSAEIGGGAPWLAAALPAVLGIAEAVWAPAEPVTRQLTHRDLVLVPACTTVVDGPEGTGDLRWVGVHGLGDIGMPAAFRALALAIGLGDRC